MSRHTLMLPWQIFFNQHNQSFAPNVTRIEMQLPLEMMKKTKNLNWMKRWQEIEK